MEESAAQAAKEKAREEAISAARAKKAIEDANTRAREMEKIAKLEARNAAKKKAQDLAREKAVVRSILTWSLATLVPPIVALILYQLGIVKIGSALHFGSVLALFFFHFGVLLRSTNGYPARDLDNHLNLVVAVLIQILTGTFWFCTIILALEESGTV